MSETNTPDRQTIVRLAILVEGGLIVLSWLLGWLMRQEPLARFHWDGFDALRGLAATLPLLVLFLLMTRWPVGSLARIKQFSNEVIRPLLAPCKLVDLIGISVLAGLGEEMLFRGVFQGAFTRWFGNPWLGVALASIFFGLLHAITLTYAVLAALMSVYLGWLWNVTDNLLVVVIVHGLYDFLVLIYLLRGPGSTTPVESLSDDAQQQTADAEAPPEDAESLP